MTRRDANRSTLFRAVLRTELLGLLRDRRALFSAIVLPVLLYPLLFVGQRWLERVSKETLEAKIVNAGVDLSRAPGTLGERLRELLERETPIEIGEFDASPLRELEPELARGTLEAYEREGVLARRAMEAGHDVLVAAIAIDEEPGIELRAWFDGTRDLSIEGRARAERALETLHAEATQALVAATLGADPARGLVPRAVDVASQEDQSGAALGKFLPLIAVLVLLSGGSYAALSTFAGEREGCTLETLLVQPVPSNVIAAAKFSAVLLTAVATFVVNAGSILASSALGFGGLPGVGAAGGAGLALGAGRLASAAFVFLPAAVLLCAVLCLVCGRARTFREGQNLLLPLMLVSLLPALLATQQDVELDLLLAAVPLAGPSLCMRDALRGELVPGLVAWAFAANTGWAMLALARIGKILDAERVLSTAGDENEDARRAVQSRTALRWGVACVFAIYLVGGTLQAWSLVPGLVITLLVLVPLFAWLSARGTARRARESIAATLQLRTPRLAHVAGAILLAPALAQLAMLLLGWQERELPMPVRSGAEALTREIEGLAFLSQFLLLALLPALGEELFFRGALFGALRRDVSLTVNAGWQFLLFGAAHASIYRFLPTGLLGVVLTLVAARGKSLWPCVALHAAYNGWALAAMRHSELTDPLYALAAIPGLLLFTIRPRT